MQQDTAFKAVPLHGKRQSQLISFHKKLLEDASIINVPVDKYNSNYILPTCQNHITSTQHNCHHVLPSTCSKQIQKQLIFNT